MEVLVIPSGNPVTHVDDSPPSAVITTYFKDQDLRDLTSSFLTGDGFLISQGPPLSHSSLQIADFQLF